MKGTREGFGIPSGVYPVLPEVYPLGGLRAFRQTAGLKQQTLADRSGLTQQAVSITERGGWMTARTAASLARVLGADDSELQVSHNLFWLEHWSRKTVSPRQALRDAQRLLAMIEDWDLPMEETRRVVEVYEHLLESASLKAGRVT